MSAEEMPTYAGRTIREWIIAGLDEYSHIDDYAEMCAVADRLIAALITKGHRQLDVDKVRANAERLIEENRDWLKKMADK